MKNVEGKLERPKNFSLWMTGFVILGVFMFLYGETLAALFAWLIVFYERSKQ